jgi:tetratricopeptide (TPR) repeat protein
MRAALIVPFTGPAGADVSTELTNDDLRAFLESPAAERRLVPLPTDGLPALARALAIDAIDDPNVLLVVAAGGHRVLAAEEAESLGLERISEDALSVLDTEVEACMSQAYDATYAGDFRRAEQCYLAADRRLGHEASPRRALILVSLGDMARAQGRIDEAIAWLDRALAIAPSHIGALQARAGLALHLGENAVAAALLHRLVDNLESEADRAHALSTIAARSLEAAADAIRRALVLRPADRSLLERLRAVHEARGDWESAVGVAVDLAEGTQRRDQRARALAQAAQLCSERTGNTARAVALYEAAIEDDPQVPGAFAAVEQELLRAEDFSGVAAAYERQLERLAQMDANDERCRLLARLAEVQRDHLRDDEAALSALERLVELAPDDALPRAALADLLAGTRQLERAVGELETAAELMPSRVETYRRLYELFGAMRNEDRAYATSAALVALGEADINEQMTYAQHSPSSVLATRRRFDPDVWQKLAPPSHDAGLDRVAAALEAAAIEVWLAQHPDRAAARIDERLRQKPAKTTVSAVRAAAWAAELLGVAEPAIYAQADNDRVSVATLPMREHALLLGRHVLAGRSVPELSFILARHLSYSRPGWRILTFYSDLIELEALLRAACAIVRPELPALRELAPRAKQLKALLDPKLDKNARDMLAAAVDQVLARDARLDLLSWARDVETTACRAALLASGDVTVATTALAVSGVLAGGVSARDRTLALLPFGISKRYSALRHFLGVALDD